MQSWKTVDSQTMLDHPVLKVMAVTRSRPGRGEHPFVVLSSPDWVNVIPITEQGEVVLIKQWRHGTGETTLEIPGGLIDPGETPQVAAARELAEETGYECKELIPLGKVRPNPALFDNTCYTFLAKGAWAAGPARPDETEEIEVLTVDQDELKAMVADGRIDHCVVVAALAYLWLHDGALAQAGDSVPLSDDI